MAEGDVSAFIESEALLTLQDYLTRGRQFADFSTEELIGRLRVRFREWMNCLHSAMPVPPYHHRERDDIQCELHLRGVEFLKLIPTEWEALKLASDASLERLLSDPPGCAKTERNLSDQIEIFRKVLKAKPAADGP